MPNSSNRRDLIILEESPVLKGFTEGAKLNQTSAIGKECIVAHKCNHKGVRLPIICKKYRLMDARNVTNPSSAKLPNLAKNATSSSSKVFGSHKRSTSRISLDSLVVPNVKRLKHAQKYRQEGSTSVIPAHISSEMKLSLLKHSQKGREEGSISAMHAHTLSEVKLRSLKHSQKGQEEGSTSAIHAHTSKLSGLVIIGYLAGIIL